MIFDMNEGSVHISCTVDAEGAEQEEQTGLCRRLCHPSWLQQLTVGAEPLSTRLLGAALFRASPILFTSALGRNQYDTNNVTATDWRRLNFLVVLLYVKCDSCQL